MSKPSLEERLRKIADWIDEGGEVSVREPDSDELRSIADEVEALGATMTKYEKALRGVKAESPWSVAASIARAALPKGDGQ